MSSIALSGFAPAARHAPAVCPAAARIVADPVCVAEQPRNAALGVSLAALIAAAPLDPSLLAQPAWAADAPETGTVLVKGKKVKGEVKPELSGKAMKEKKAKEAKPVKAKAKADGKKAAAPASPRP